MKKTNPQKPPFIPGFPEVCAVLIMTAAFIGGAYVEQGLLGMPDRVNFKQCLPWFFIFTLMTMYFNSAFELSRRLHQIAFSVFTSILMINIFMMVLPFFDVMYYVYYTTLLIIVFFELLGMSIWIFFFHSYWLKTHPPLSTAVVCEDMEYGNEVGLKVNFHSKTNRINGVLTYSSSILEDIEPFESVILVHPSADIRNEIALKCWEAQKELIIVPDIFELIVNNAALVQFDDLMSYKAKSMGLSFNQRIIKRTVDIIGSSLALTLLSPLMLAIAVIVRRDGGKAIFSQKRVTRGGREFELYKFRTMIPDAEKQPRLEAVAR